METRELTVNMDEIRDSVSKLSDDDLRIIFKQSDQWAAYQHFTGLMNGIAAEMREIPVLPSEEIKKENTNALEKVEFVEEGGVHTWMSDQKYPYKGYPHFEFVDKIDQIKKINRAMLSGLYHQLKRRPKIFYLSVLPALWLTKDLLRSWVYVFYRQIDRFKIKTIRYCDAVREIHRAFSVIRPGEKPHEVEFREMTRDLLCMILECDNAYRYRAQDILPLLDKVALAKNPTAELVRLSKVMSSREKTQEIRDTWTLLHYALTVYLRFDRSVTKMLQFALTQIDLDKVKLSIEDKAYCIPRKDYQFGFMLKPGPEDIKMIAEYQEKEKAKLPT